MLIPTAATFWDLHSAIQDLFKWNHSHLHQFYHFDKLLEKHLTFGIPTDEDETLGLIVHPSWKHNISKYLNLEEPDLTYVYDLGDNWMHIIELENILPAAKCVTFPVCIDGELNSPPDDCGGGHGYEAMLEVLADPSHVKHTETRGWVESMKGGPFDPKHFDPDEVKFIDPKLRYRASFQ